MLLWLNLLLIFFGIGLFGLSYSLFRKSKEDKEGLRIYGAFGYGGVALLSGEQIRSLDIMYHILGGIVLLH